MAKKFRYQHILSAVENKEPESLLAGEIAVNKFAGKEKLFIQNTDDEIIPFVPEHTVDEKIEEAISGVSVDIEELSGNVKSISTAIIEDVDELSGSVKSIATAIIQDIDELSGNVKSLAIATTEEFEIVSGNIQTISSSTVNIQTDLTTLSGSVSTLSGNVNTLSASTVNIDEKVDEEIRRAASAETILQEEIDAITDNIETIVITTCEDIDELSGNVTTISGNVETVQTGLTTLSGSVETVQTGLTTLSGNIEELSASCQESEYVIAESLNDLNGNVTTISGNVETVQTGLTTLSGSVETVQTGLTTLSGNIEELSASCQESEYVIAESLNDLNGRINETSGSVETNETSIQTLSGNLQTLSSSTVNIQTGLTTLSGSVINIEKKTGIYDFDNSYLTFITQEDGTFKFSGSTTANTLSYSLDNGNTWTALAHNTNTPTISSGSTIMWKGSVTPQSYEGIGKFVSSGRYEAEGNVMSLTHSDNFATATTVQNYEFYGLFNSSTGLTTVENLVLPATTLASGCYSSMFNGCTRLTQAPELPATTLAQQCYNSMFWGCTSLTKAPSILPATTLTGSCYGNMFKSCTSLTTAPELPATTLASGCYSSMFNGCTRLTQAPELPATTLAQQCYDSMFYGCTNLNYIKCLATNISATNCTYNWVSGVASAGTFIKDVNMTSWTTGVNGIPTNWTIQDDINYINCGEY